jgi:hypothetical protein
MQATPTEMFAFRRSGLDAFLHASVGAEENGSALTILSVLARLGKDPWAEAAKWATLPKAAVIDNLAESIKQMPLPPTALADARDNAARLVQLLPAASRGPQDSVAARPDMAKLKRALLTAFLFALAAGMMLAVMPMSRPPSQDTAQLHPSKAMQASKAAHD